MKEERDQPSQPESRNSWMVQVARYSHLGIALPVSTFVGWLIGSALDRWLGTTWIYVAGIILGSIAGFVELIRVAVKPDSK